MIKSSENNIKEKKLNLSASKVKLSALLSIQNNSGLTASSPTHISMMTSPQVKEPMIKSGSGISGIMMQAKPLKGQAMGAGGQGQPVFAESMKLPEIKSLPQLP